MRLCVKPGVMPSQESCHGENVVRSESEVMADLWMPSVGVRVAISVVHEVAGSIVWRYGGPYDVGICMLICRVTHVYTFVL